MSLEPRIEKLENTVRARGDDPRVRIILVCIYDGDKRNYTQSQLDTAVERWYEDHPGSDGPPVVTWDGDHFLEETKMEVEEDDSTN